jgi:multidrug resistance efflux pump
MAGPHESVIAETQFQATAVALQPVETITETIALESEMAAAQARLDYLLAQPLPEDIAVAQAEVTQAQLNVEAKRAQLELALLVAPTDGTVIEVLLNDHEYARVGETVVQMSNLDRLSVQTEMYDFELVGISLGDTAIISFDALPGVEIEGSVYGIVPDDSEARGGRYIVMLRLSEIPEGLRWGMTARVVIPPQ